MKGVDLAGIFTGTGDFNDSAIRAGPFAVAAFNTYIIINMGTALIYGNGLFGQPFMQRWVRHRRQTSVIMYLFTGQAEQPSGRTAMTCCVRSTGSETAFWQLQ